MWDFKKLNIVWFCPASLPWEVHHHPWIGVFLFLLLHPLQAQQKQWPWLAEHWVPEWVRRTETYSLQFELEAFLRLQCCSTHLWSCPAATPTLVVVVVSRWCPWPVVDACTMAPSSMSCSMLWDSTMNRPALTGTTTSKSCCTMFSLVMQPSIIQKSKLERGSSTLWCCDLQHFSLSNTLLYDQITQTNGIPIKLNSTDYIIPAKQQ